MPIIRNFDLNGDNINPLYRNRYGKGNGMRTLQVAYYKVKSGFSVRRIRLLLIYKTNRNR